MYMNVLLNKYDRLYLSLSHTTMEDDDDDDSAQESKRDRHVAESGCQYPHLSPASKQQKRH